MTENSIAYQRRQSTPCRFQKRHYEIVAALLAPYAREGNADGLVSDFADCFEADNERFDRDRFYEAVYGKA